MKKKVVFVLAIILLLVVARVYAVIDRTTDIYNSQIESSDYVAVGLTENKIVEQKFKSVEDYLDGMSIKLDVSGNPGSVTLEYTLIEAESQKEVAQGEMSLEDVRSGKFFPLEFERVNESKGKTYIFKITVKECDENSVVSVYYANDILVARTLRHGFDLETFIITVCFMAYVLVFMKWLSKLFNQGNRM